jgi:hypothetical protein
VRSCFKKKKKKKKKKTKKRKGEGEGGREEERKARKKEGRKGKILQDQTLPAIKFNSLGLIGSISHIQSKTNLQQVQNKN